MAIGVFGALLYVAHKFSAADGQILVALYFIILQFLIICSLALLFSSFSSPLLSAVFAFSLFVIGSFADDLRGFAGMTNGVTRWIATGAAYLVPNFSALNVISTVAHYCAACRRVHAQSMERCDEMTSKNDESRVSLGSARPSKRAPHTIS